MRPSPSPRYSRALLRGHHYNAIVQCYLQAHVSLVEKVEHLVNPVAVEGMCVLSTLLLEYVLILVCYFKCIARVSVYVYVYFQA